jgi:hypothetical protein
MEHLHQPRERPHDKPHGQRRDEPQRAFQPGLEGVETMDGIENGSE